MHLNKVPYVVLSPVIYKIHERTPLLLYIVAADLAAALSYRMEDIVAMAPRPARTLDQLINCVARKALPREAFPSFAL